MSEADDVLLSWLCNECYGKNFIITFKHGVTSETVVDVDRSTDITVNIGGTTISLIKRNYIKSSYFKHDFFNPHGVAWDGPIDTSYVSYFDATCWGDQVFSDDGSYSVSNSFENTQIYFADLREDILVYYHEAGGNTGSTSGDEAMGAGLGYASWQGSPTPACQGINTRDAIKMPLALDASITKREIVTLGNVVPYTATIPNPQIFNVAASDRSGYCGGVSYECYHWGDYARIDTSLPYDCEEGTYTEEARPDALEEYRNDWDGTGTYRAMDDLDASQFNASFNISGGVDHLPNGTYDYPSFIEIDPLPRGSWCVDAAGNTFYSQLTRDLQTYNTILDKDDGAKDPEEISSLSSYDGVVFYPIGPA